MNAAKNDGNGIGRRSAAVDHIYPLPAAGPSELSTSHQEEILARAARVADVGLAIGGALALLVSLRFGYLSWIGQRQFTTPFNVAVYLGLPGVTAVALFAALRLGPVHKLRLLTSCVATAVSLYAVELFLDLHRPKVPALAMTQLARARDKERYAADLTRRFGPEIDLRTPAQVIADLRRGGVDAIPFIMPNNDLFITEPNGWVRSAIDIDGREVMPLSSVSNRRTLVCNESGRWVGFRADSRGFKNPDGVWGFYRLEIAALGNSFTFGSCVPADQNFVALIRHVHRATVNLGMSGSGPLMMLATLKEYLPRFRPRSVLWCYYEGNDLTDLQVERKSALLTQYLTEGFTQPALARQDDLDRAMLAELPRLEAAEQHRMASRTPNAVVSRMTSFTKLASLRERLGLVGLTDTQEIDAATDLAKANMEVFRQILSQAQAQVAGWNGQLYFVYLPEWARYASYSSWGMKRRPEVLTLVRDLGIPLIEVDPAFRAQGDPLSLFPFREVGHYTETGHRLVAEEILRSLPAPTGSR